MVYMPMSYLYGKKFVGPITPLVEELREELHTQPYDTISWWKVRHLCAKVSLPTLSNAITPHNIDKKRADKRLLLFAGRSLLSPSFSTGPALGQPVHIHRTVPEPLALQQVKREGTSSDHEAYSL